MKQDFEYEEEEFEKQDPDEAEHPESIDDMIDDETEEKLTFKDLVSKNKTAFICVGVILGLAALVSAAVFFVNSSKTDDNMVEETTETTAEEVDGEIEFDENGFIVLDDESTVEDDSSFHYSSEDIQKLREAGYTNTEIEDFEEMAVENVDNLIAEIKEQKKKSILEIYRGFMRDAQNSGNEEYLYALANTWLGLAPQEMDLSGDVDDYYKDSCNADYWKLPLQGYQPMLKLRFTDKQDVERTVYMAVEPTTYANLRDSGNIVISYNFINAYGCEFITNIQEVK